MRAGRAFAIGAGDVDEAEAAMGIAGARGQAERVPKPNFMPKS